MDWKKERDELIAQTLAFVQSVSAQMPEAAQWRLSKPELRLPPVSPPAQLQPEIGAAPSVQAAPAPSVKPSAPAPSPVSSALLARPSVHSEVEQECRARIASFRANQERFNRERAEYFSATIARLRATLQDVPPPRPGQITQPRD
jgi:hypothetical protein